MASPNPIGASAVCDSHVHVFDPARFAYATHRRFTPGTATVAELRRFHQSLGVTRAVLVQPSVYAGDHRCLVDALTQLGSHARGISVLTPEMTTEEIARLAEAGCCATRLNLAIDGDRNADDAIRRVQWLADRIPADWHVQVHAHLDTIAAMGQTLRTLKRTVVIDHFGLPQKGVASPGWVVLLDLLKSGNVYVKMSAPYLVSDGTDDHAKQLVQSLTQEAPSQLLWGTNWPHTQGIARNSASASIADDDEPFRSVDDTAILAWMSQCMNPKTLRLVLAENAQSLYRFPTQVRQPAAL